MIDNVLIFVLRNMDGLGVLTVICSRPGNISWLKNDSHHNSHIILPYSLKFHHQYFILWGPQRISFKMQIIHVKEHKPLSDSLHLLHRQGKANQHLWSDIYILGIIMLGLLPPLFNLIFPPLRHICSSADEKPPNLKVSLTKRDKIR